MVPDSILPYSQGHAASPLLGLIESTPHFQANFFATAPYLWFIHTYARWIPLVISSGLKWPRREADRFSPFYDEVNGVECSLRHALVACCIFKHKTTVLLVPCSELRSLCLLRFSNSRFLCRSSALMEGGVKCKLFYFAAGPQPNTDLGRHIVQVSRSCRHTNTVGPLRTCDRFVAEAATYTTQNKHKRQRSMPWAVFEPAMAAKLSQTYALNRTAHRQ